MLKISITSPLLKSWFGWIIPVISESAVFWKVTSSNWTLVLCKSVTSLPLTKETCADTPLPPVPSSSNSKASPTL